ncbi:MAG: trigger factor [Flavobacteriales bacterium]|nr:trigger factor [Flavobacteriales bacterium]
MKIKQSKPKKMIATLTVEVSESDYIEKVIEVLKKYRRDAVVPGFRKGKTPMSIIEKQYKKSIIADEVNKILQDNLYSHITDNKIRVLGSPLPISDTDIDWENNIDFVFEYEIGLAPDFEVNITTKDKLTYYNIKADNKLVDGYCNDIAKRYGKMSNPSISIDGDLVYCSINQLDVNGTLMDNGISNDATVSMDVIKDEKHKEKFIGLKSGDKLVLDVMKVFTNHSDLAAMLKINHDQLHNLSSDSFEFTVQRINRLAPAEFDKNLFDKVYGEGVVKELKEFKQKITDEAEQSFVVESDRMLKNDVVLYLVEKIKLDLPDEFLKKWLVKTSDKPLTIEQVETDYPQYAKSLKWQLIENKILEKNKIKVNNEDLLDFTNSLVRKQMQQYGQSSTDDKQIIDISENILKNEEERKKISNQLFDEKTLSIYKESFKLNQKSISYDDFVKLATEK